VWFGIQDPYLEAAYGTETVAGLPLGRFELVAEVMNSVEVTRQGLHAEKIGGNKLQA
jgi:hypothetical protein